MNIISLIAVFLCGVAFMPLILCIIAMAKDKESKDGESKNNVHFYLARDQDGLLWLYIGKPVRGSEVFMADSSNGSRVLTSHIKDFGLNKEDYSDLKWEDEPVEVFLNLKN